MEKIQQQIDFATLAKQQLAGLEEDIETAAMKFKFKDIEYRNNEDQIVFNLDKIYTVSVKDNGKVIYKDLVICVKYDSYHFYNINFGIGQDVIEYYEKPILNRDSLKDFYAEHIAEHVYNCLSDPKKRTVNLNLKGFDAIKASNASVISEEIKKIIIKDLDQILSENEYVRYVDIKSKYIYIVDKKNKTVKIAEVDDIYSIDNLPEEYEGYIDEDDLKEWF